jgi:molecular chaperone DnaK (HSP70)
MKNAKIAIATMFAGMLIGLPIIAEDSGGEGDEGRAPETKKCEQRGSKERMEGEGRGGHLKSAFSRLEVENPEKFEELKKLREENPEKFRQEAKEALEEMKKEREEERAKMRELVQAYRKDKNDSSKNELKQMLTKDFETRLSGEKNRLSKSDEMSKKVKERVEKREKMKNEIISSKLNEMLEDPDLKW